MKEWLKELCPEIAEWQVEAIYEATQKQVAAEREKLAQWMMSLGYATGHGDTMEDLLDELGTQIAEGLETENLMVRAECAHLADEYAAANAESDNMATAFQHLAGVIRARGKK